MGLLCGDMVLAGISVMCGKVNDNLEIPKEYYNNILESNEYEDKKLLEFMLLKFGIIKYRQILKIIDTIDKYTDQYTEIPYDDIIKETNYTYDELKTAVDAVLEYEDTLDDDTENIDYIIDNPPNIEQKEEITTKTDQYKGMSDKILFELVKSISQDPNLISQLQNIQQTSQDKNNSVNLAQQIITGMINNNPKLIDQFKGIIESCYDGSMVKPITTQSPAIGQIASAIINNPELNDGIVGEQTQNNDSPEEQLTVDPMNQKDEEKKDPPESSQPPKDEKGKGGAKK